MLCCVQSKTLVDSWSNSARIERNMRSWMPSILFFWNRSTRDQLMARSNANGALHFLLSTRVAILCNKGQVVSRTAYGATQLKIICRVSLVREVTPWKSLCLGVYGQIWYDAKLTILFFSVGWLCYSACRSAFGPYLGDDSYVSHAQCKW